MRTTILILLILFSVACFGQDTTKQKIDSLDMKVISMRELEGYLKRIDLMAQKQFDISEVKKYEQILYMIKSIYADADKRRRIK